MKVLAVIPSRMGSTRLPGKPLLPINGKPMVQYVYEGVKACSQVDKVIVATDAQEIFDAVKEFGGEVMMTSSEHPTGTDRIAEVVSQEDSGYDIVLNIQGDEPLVSGELVAALVAPFSEMDEAVMTTLKKKINDIDHLSNPNTVKVVTDLKGKALYFSRSPIPYPRNNIAGIHYRHIGMYGFKRDFLFTYCKLKATANEECESLEQLRVLDNGYPIYVSETDVETVDVNVKEDLEKVEKALEQRSS